MRQLGRTLACPCPRRRRRASASSPAAEETTPKLLPGATAKEITENLDTVKQLASEGECIGAADAAEEVSAQVEALDGVDPKLKQALERGAGG